LVIVAIFINRSRDIARDRILTASPADFAQP
jgi:hypothetical protein